MKTNTTRFSGRVEDYIKFRPKYPYQLIVLLKDRIGLHDSYFVADIGSGTGISSELFINNGNKVFAIEPNKEMREAAELIFTGNSNFCSVDSSAAKSNLHGESIDVIFYGQAFLWFDIIKSKVEFNRILRQHRHIILAWNVRCEKVGFQKDYENLLSLK
jgi:SAM-dependent methyltransferase